VTSDLSTWDIWWAYNRDEYLDLKLSTWKEDPATGGDTFFLGRGQRTPAAQRLRPSDEVLLRDVVPALLGVLRSEDERTLVASALIALGQIGQIGEGNGHGLDLAREFQPFLAHGNQTVSETAVVSLGLLRTPEVVPLLAAILDDGAEGRRSCGRSEVPVRSRAFAALGLGLVAERTEIEDVRRFVVYHLVEALRSDDTPSSELGVACVTALGMFRLPDGHNEPGLPVNTCRGSQIAFLADLIQDDQAKDVVRAHAARSLARLVDREDADREDPLREAVGRILLQTLKRDGDNREIRFGCILALGLVADADDDPVDRDIQGVLVKAATDNDRVARSFAQIALAQVAGAPGGSSGEGAVQEVRRLLLGQLAKGKTTVRPWSGLALGLLGHGLAGTGHGTSADASEALRDTLGQCRSSVDAAAYAIALGLRRDPLAEDVLLEKLAFFKESATQGQLALALGMIGSRKAVPVLRELVAESVYSPDFLRQAAIGLALLGDKELVPQLMELMRSSNSSAVHAAVASVMGYVGDSRAIEPLVAMVRDRTQITRSRAYAIVALGHVGDRDPLPWTHVVATNLNYQAHSDILNSADQTGLLNMR